MTPQEVEALDRALSRGFVYRPEVLRSYLLGVTARRPLILLQDERLAAKAVAQGMAGPFQEVVLKGFAALDQLSMPRT